MARGINPTITSIRLRQGITPSKQLTAPQQLALPTPGHMQLQPSPSYDQPKAQIDSSPYTSSPEPRRRRQSTFTIPTSRAQMPQTHPALGLQALSEEGESLSCDEEDVPEHHRRTPIYDGSRYPKYVPGVDPTSQCGGSPSVASNSRMSGFSHGCACWSRMGNRTPHHHSVSP